MKPTDPVKPFKFIDRTKQLSNTEKIIAGFIIFFGLLFLYSEWEWRDRQDREAEFQRTDYCMKLRAISEEIYLGDKVCNK